MYLSFLLVIVLVGIAGIGVLLIMLGVSSTSRSAVRPPNRLAVAISRLRGPLLGPRLVVGLAAGLAVGWGAGWPVAGIALAALIVCWPILFGGADQRDRIAELEALAAWTESLKDLVSGAAGLREAIPISVDTASPLLRAPLTRLRGLLAARESLAAALPQLAADLADPTAEMVVAVLILNARSRGPGLAEALAGLATSIREELELHRQIAAQQRGDRRSVKIMVVVTACFAAAMAFVFPPQFSHPYRTLQGQLVLLIVLGIFAVAFAWMRHLARPDVPAAFLTSPAQERSR